jgi:hypothetical protein
MEIPSNHALSGRIVLRKWLTLVVSFGDNWKNAYQQHLQSRCDNICKRYIQPASKLPYNARYLTVQEILFRLTAYKRDFIALKLLYGDTPDELSHLHATIINVETILEVLAILTAPFITYWFNHYSILFNWYGGKIKRSMYTLIIQAITQTSKYLESWLSSLLLK